MEAVRYYSDGTWAPWRLKLSASCGNSKFLFCSLIRLTKIGRQSPTLPALCQGGLSSQKRQCGKRFYVMSWWSWRQTNRWAVRVPLSSQRESCRTVTGECRGWSTYGPEGSKELWHSICFICFCCSCRFVITNAVDTHIWHVWYKVYMGP